MPTQVQFRRANTSDMASITGALGELFVDTDKLVVVVHDGSTPGGFPLAAAADPEFSGNATFEQVEVGNSTVNVFVNSTFVQIANSTRTMNLRSNRLVVGNVTANTTALLIGANVSMNTSTARFGNSTVNTHVNSSAINVRSAEVTTNTFSFGSSNVSANGFAVESNNLVKAWGQVQANDSVGDISLPITFGAVFSIQLTPQNGTHDPTHFPIITAQNTSTCNVRTANATAITIHYEVIGNNA